MNAKEQATARESRRERAAARLLARGRPLELDRTSGPVWVVAAHPDEEALSCGGLIARFAAEHVRVRIAFLTSGEWSHGRQLAAAEMGPQREVEAIAAAAALGVQPEDVHFIRSPDTAAAFDTPRAERLMRSLFGQARPGLLVLPDAADRHPDIAAAHRVARDAAAFVDAAPLVVEYPYWAWRVWPFVRVQAPWPWQGREEARDRAGVIAASTRHRLGRGLVRRFPFVLEPGGPMVAKAAAVAAHRSQMEHRGGDAGWWTLGDLNRGDFLDRLLRSPERYRITTPADSIDRLA